MKTNKSTQTVTVIEGLESAETVATATVQVEAKTTAQYLETAPSFIPEFVSSKFDPIREEKVQAGLAIIREMLGDKINPLVIALGKYWEVKPERAAIKALIDAEAEAQHANKDTYLQVTLRDNVDKLAEIQTAIDRLKYAINYYKPRTGIKAATQQFNINGKLYIVDLDVLSAAKVTYADDKKALTDYLVSVSAEVAIAEL